MESHKHNLRQAPLDAGVWPMLGLVMKALANPLRLRILDALAAERTIGDLASELGIERSLASQHLHVLRHAGLVECERVRQKVIARPTRSAKNLGRCCGNLVDCICDKTRAN